MARVRPRSHAGVRVSALRPAGLLCPAATRQKCMKNTEQVVFQLTDVQAQVRYCPLKTTFVCLTACAPTSPRRHPLAPAHRRVMSFSPFIMLPTLFGVLGHIGFCFLLLDKWESLELVSG